MKHIYQIILALTLSFVLIGCGAGEDSSTTESNPTVTEESQEKDNIEPGEKNQIEHDKSATESNTSEEVQTGSATTKDQDIEKNNELDELAEGSTIESTIDTKDIQLDIVEDNSNKRVILIKDEEGHKTHKSIFLKKKNRLKIIEFDKGQIFNQVIDSESSDKETAKKSTTEKPTSENHSTNKNNELDGLTEGATIASTIGTNDIQLDIVEDNNYKRVMVIKNKDGHKTHKSVFLKTKNRLKIIEFDRGQIFNEII